MSRYSSVTMHRPPSGGGSCVGSGDLDEYYESYSGDGARDTEEIRRDRTLGGRHHTDILEGGLIIGDEWAAVATTTAPPLARQESRKKRKKGGMTLPVADDVILTSGFKQPSQRRDSYDSAFYKDYPV